MSDNLNTYQKIYNEMIIKHQTSSQELLNCKNKMDSIDFEISKLQNVNNMSKVNLTSMKEPLVWKKIGKCFFAQDIDKYLNDVSIKEKKYNEEKSNLEKKMNYLLITIKNIEEAMNKRFAKNK